MAKKFDVEEKILEKSLDLFYKHGFVKASIRDIVKAVGITNSEVLGFLEIRKGVSGGAFVVEIDMQKARESIYNFLHFKNLSLKDLNDRKGFFKETL